jgi:hypothetical protein
VGLENIFGDEMLSHRPIAGKERAIRIGQGGDIVDQSVKPDIGYVTVIKW